MVTVMCIIALFAIMQFTGRVDWEAMFHKGNKADRALAVPAPAGVADTAAGEQGKR